jgi:hypothetical protein
MLTIIDSFILNKDIASWFETIDDDYQDYYNPVFDIRIKFELEDDDFMLSIFRANEIAVSIFTFDSYSKKTNDEILDHVLKRVWELINDSKAK